MALNVMEKDQSICRLSRRWPTLKKRTVSIKDSCTRTKQEKNVHRLNYSMSFQRKRLYHRSD